MFLLLHFCDFSQTKFNARQRPLNFNRFDPKLAQKLCLSLESIQEVSLFCHTNVCSQLYSKIMQNILTLFPDTLMKAPARTLAKLQNDVITPEEKSCAMRFIFRPVIEQKLTEDSIITQTPEQLLKSFDTLQMPMMSGVTSAEGVLALNLNKYCLEKFSKYAEDWLVPRFMSSPEGLDRRAIVEEVKRFYLGDKDVCWATINESCALLSDFTFVGTSNLSAEWIAKYQPNVRHYHYLFNFVGRMNIMKPLFNVGAVDGASHGDDNFYLFRFVIDAFLSYTV